MKLRRVQLGDCFRVWEWANELTTRAASFNTEYIRWDAHKEWFEGMLGTHFYIAEVGGEPVGTVRFKNNRISVNCDKEYRNNGIGTEIIKQSLKMVRDIGLIQAYIKKTNKQSIKAFGKAGFTRMGDTVYKETPTVIMEINLEEKIDNGLHTTGK